VFRRGSESLAVTLCLSGAFIYVSVDTRFVNCACFYGHGGNNLSMGLGKFMLCASLLHHGRRHIMKYYSFRLGSPV
jgi:hypothetical protein